MSLRGEEWREFARYVENHIEQYTVPQYGDKGQDQVTSYSAADCVLAVRKYANRYGQNMREGQQLLDMVKMAHYAGMAYFKEREKDNTVTTRLVFGGQIDSDSFPQVTEMIRACAGKKIRVVVED